MHCENYKEKVRIVLVVFCENERDGKERTYSSTVNNKSSVKLKVNVNEDRYILNGSCAVNEKYIMMWESEFLAWNFNCQITSGSIE